MHILCSTDSNYIMPTGVMIKSVSVNNSNTDIVFHIMVDDNVKEMHREQLRNVLAENKHHTIVFHVVDDNMFDSFPNIGITKEHITKATYYRLIVTEILEKKIDKVLYLDGDIIVNDSLTKLWDFNINNHAIGAVVDMSESKQDYKRLGYSPDCGYFNAGVLLINLNYWRNHNVIDVFNDTIKKKSDKLEQHDQDVLNIAFANIKVELPLKYNFQNGFLYKKEYLGIDSDKYKDELKDAKKNFVIIHYVSRVKPWHKECNHPLKNIWFEYLKQTMWAHYTPKRKFPVSTIGNILRFFKVLPPLSPLDNPFSLETTSNK